MKKCYRCYREYPSDSADVTIYVRESPYKLGEVMIEFFPKDPLAEPFKRKLCGTFIEAFGIVDEYILQEKFVKFTESA